MANQDMLVCLVKRSFTWFKGEQDESIRFKTIRGLRKNGNGRLQPGLA